MTVAIHAVCAVMLSDFTSLACLRLAKRDVREGAAFVDLSLIASS
jgi:hypothetical protein